MKILINKEQREYLYRNFLKISEGYGNMDREKKRHFARIANKFNGVNEVVDLKRNEIAAVTLLLSEAVDTLNNKVIPEYKSRDGDFKDYIDRANELVKLLSSLLNVIEKKLELLDG